MPHRKPPCRIVRRTFSTSVAGLCLVFQLVCVVVYVSRSFCPTTSSSWRGHHGMPPEKKNLPPKKSPPAPVRGQCHQLPWGGSNSPGVVPTPLGWCGANASSSPGVGGGCGVNSGKRWLKQCQKKLETETDAQSCDAHAADANYMPEQLSRAMLSRVCAEADYTTNQQRWSDFIDATGNLQVVPRPHRRC